MNKKRRIYISVFLIGILISIVMVPKEIFGYTQKDRNLEERKREVDNRIKELGDNISPADESHYEKIYYTILENK